MNMRDEYHGGEYEETEELHKFDHPEEPTESQQIGCVPIAEEEIGGSSYPYTIPKKVTLMG